MDEPYKDWASKDSDPIKDIKDLQEAMKDDLGCKEISGPQVNNGVYIKPSCKVNFSTIDVCADKNHVDEQGKPRKDVLIYQDRLLCHPNMEDRLKQGLTLFFGNKRWTTQESPPP